MLGYNDMLYKNNALQQLFTLEKCVITTKSRSQGQLTNECSCA